MMGAGPAITTEHTESVLPLSAIRENCFVKPITIRPSSVTGVAMPKALPDWRGHARQ